MYIFCSKALPALLHIGVDKAFSGCFVNNSVLIKLLWYLPCIAGNRYMFYIHLPFHTQCCWRVIRLGLIDLFGGRSLTRVAQTPINTI